MISSELYVQYSYAVIKKKRDLVQASRFFGRYYSRFLEYYKRMADLAEKANKLTESQNAYYAAIMAQKIKESLIDLTGFINEGINYGEFGNRGSIKVGNYTYNAEAATYMESNGKAIAREIPGMPLDNYSEGYTIPVVEQTFNIKNAANKIVKIEGLTSVLANEPGIYEVTVANLKIAEEFLNGGSKAICLNRANAQGLAGIILIQLMNI